MSFRNTRQGQWQSTEWVGNEVMVRYSLQLTPGS